MNQTCVPATGAPLALGVSGAKLTRVPAAGFLGSAMHQTSPAFIVAKHGSNVVFSTVHRNASPRCAATWDGDWHEPLCACSGRLAGGLNRFTCVGCSGALCQPPIRLAVATMTTRISLT